MQKTDTEYPKVSIIYFCDYFLTSIKTSNTFFHKDFFNREQPILCNVHRSLHIHFLLQSILTYTCILVLSTSNGKQIVTEMTLDMLLAMNLTLVETFFGAFLGVVLIV